MKTRNPARPAAKPDMLRLWMGAPEDERPGRRASGRPVLTALLVIGAAVGAVVLAKYAIDVLAIMLALIVAGLVFHIVGSRIARSPLLTPGTFAIVAAIAALLAYVVLVPTDGVTNLGRYLPSPVVRFLTWSEGQGWGGRVVFSPRASAPGAETAAVRPPSPAAAPEPPRTAEPVRSADPLALPPPTSGPVSLSVSNLAPATGQPVVLVARLGEGTERDEVWFYDGAAFLGSGAVRTEGNARVASLTVTGLGPGAHVLRAAVSGPWGLWSRRSGPVTLTVK